MATRSPDGFKAEGGQGEVVLRNAKGVPAFLAMHRTSVFD